MMTRDQADEFIQLQKAILREQMAQTELLREKVQGQEESGAVGSHHQPKRSRLQ